MRAGTELRSPAALLPTGYLLAGRALLSKSGSDARQRCLTRCPRVVAVGTACGASRHTLTNSLPMCL
eukprot:6246566-Amphidinium_carterae.1